MGPPTLVDGNAWLRARPGRGVRDASMGPPTLVDGNVIGFSAGRRRRARRASMGPPTLVDGNKRETSPVRPGTSWLQWGRRLSSTETIANPGCAMCVSRSLQWGRRLSSTETVQANIAIILSSSTIICERVPLPWRVASAPQIPRPRILRYRSSLRVASGSGRRSPHLAARKASRVKT